MKRCPNLSNCSSLISCRSSLQSHLCSGPLTVSEGIGQYPKSVLKLLSCWHISPMKGPIQSSAVLANVHTSLAGANIRGVFCTVVLVHACLKGRLSGCVLPI